LLTIVVWLASLVIGFHAGLIVLTVAGFAAAVAGLKQPALGVLGVAILCTLDSTSRLYLFSGGLLRFNTLNYWLAVVIVLNFPVIAGLRGAQVRLLQVFIGLLAVEILLSADLAEGSQHVLNIATIFGLIIYFVRANRDWEAPYWAAAVSSVVSALGSLIFFLQRESLPAINENAWSFFPLTSLFLTCVYLVHPVFRQRARYVVLLSFINAVWIFLSGSRGSMLICTVCLAFIVARFWQIRGTALTLAAAMLIVIALVSQFVGQQRYAESRLTKLFDSERSITNKTSGRWDLALGGWRIFVDHPLGVGTGGFPHAWLALRSRAGISAFEGVRKEAHSGWIKVLAENGLPGILLLVSFVLSFSVVGWRRRGAGMLLPGVLVTAVLSVAFLADEFQGKGLWYLTGAMMLLERGAPRTTWPVRGREGNAPLSRVRRASLS
jgi:O-antigen ligase